MNVVNRIINAAKGHLNRNNRWFVSLLSLATIIHTSLLLMMAICEENAILSVPPVSYKHLGHIACSSDSKSEIVVPILQQSEVIGVLDIDSDELDSFDTIDARYLEEICTYIG